MPKYPTLKNARTELGLTQLQLAGKLDVGLRTIARYENGNQVPERVLLAIRQLLDQHKKRQGRK